MKNSNFRSPNCPQCRTEATQLINLYFSTSGIETVVDDLKQELAAEKNKRIQLSAHLNHKNDNDTLLNERITINPADFPNRLYVLLDRNLENSRIQRHIVNINPNHVINVMFRNIIPTLKGEQVFFTIALIKGFK